MTKGRLFVISGPSGTGKGTICSRLLNDTENMVFSVSMTTRAPRKCEKEGEDYFFVSREKFEIIKKQDGFLEWAHVYEDFYGTPKDAVMKKLQAGTDVLLDIDTQGAMNIRKTCPQGVFIFILPPSMSELEKRIKDRAMDTDETIRIRMNGAMNELVHIKNYDYYIVNDEVDDAVSRIKAIVMAEHSRVDEDTEKMIEKYKEES